MQRTWVRSVQEDPDAAATTAETLEPYSPRSASGNHHDEEASRCLLAATRESPRAAEKARTAKMNEEINKHLKEKQNNNKAPTSSQWRFLLLSTGSLCGALKSLH